MRYGSVCSGIEAATAAWHHMNWEPAFFSEIEAFPRAVLEYHYPEVPLHGDFTTIGKNQYGKIDLLVGGTPCQSFSVAGLRGGLDDDRGNLALEFCRLAQREQPRWIVWENVPGVLSSSGGRDFGSILGALEDLGYGLAYRVLDAQYFGVAQRRRRVFVVGYLGDWRPAAAVLFERHSMSGHPAPSREARKEAARAASVSTHECGGSGGPGPAVGWPADVACTLDTDFASKWGQNNQHVNAGCPLFVPDVANSITASLANAATGHNKDENVIAFDAYNQTETEGVSKTVAARNDQDTASCVAYSIMPMNSGKDYKARETEVAQPIMAGGPVGGNQGGDYSVQQSERQEQRTTPTHDVVGTLCAEDSPHGARGLSGLQTMLAGYIQPVAIGFNGDQSEKTRSMGEKEEQSPTLRAGSACHVAIGFEAHSNERPNVFAFSAKDHGGDATEELSPTLRAGGFTNSHQNGGVMPAVAYDHPGRFNNIHGGSGEHRDVMPTLEATNPKQIVASFQPTADCLTAVSVGFNEDGTARTLTARHDSSPCADRGPDVVSQTSAVRRLTPVECERLQGFPDNFTAIPWKKKGPEQCPDGPRYKALGNSMAVPVMRWIGERIQLVDDLISVL